MEDVKLYSFYKQILVINFIITTAFSVLLFYLEKPAITQRNLILFSAMPTAIKLSLLISLFIIIRLDNTQEFFKILAILSGTTLFFTIDTVLYHNLSGAILYSIIPLFIMIVTKSHYIINLETIITVVCMAISLPIFEMVNPPFKADIVNNALMLLTVFIQLLLIIKKIVNETLSVNAKSDFFQDNARRDSMTGLYNNRTFYSVVSEKVQLIAPFCIIILDIDNFKMVNDTYGHPFGDVVIKALVKSIRNSIRNQDIAFRYGGEEFAVIFPKTTEIEAFEMAKNIKKDFSAKTYDDNEEWLKTKISFTISIGLIESNKRGAAPQDIINNCDQALYQSKQNGKNQITVYHE